MSSGSRTLRAVGLGFGYHRFLVRFTVYDKELGTILARSNISGEVSSSFLSVPFLAGDSDARNWIVDALVNRVEIRKAMAEQ